MCAYKRPTACEELPSSLPYAEDLSPLRASMTLNGHILPNRICYQPMEGCDGTAEGAPDTLTRRRYLRFAKGGAGLIWFEATAIVPEGRANPRQLWITEANVDAFAELVREIKAVCLAENGYEPLVICQLTHSGRYSKPAGVPAPMIAYNRPIVEKDHPIPAERIVSDGYLASLPARYAEAAALCVKAGFDGVDIKACHGYLLSELLNAYLRPGSYGGCFENRIRLMLDATRAVKAAVPADFILSSRFNAYDGYPHPYGFGDSGTPGVPDLTEAVELSRRLVSEGMTLLNITMGCPYTNHEVNRPTTLAVEQAPYDSILRMLKGAEAVQKACPEAAVVVSGLSYLGHLAAPVAAAGIGQGLFAVAGFGRQNFAYPELAADIVKGAGMKQKGLCLTCGKCTELMRAGRTPGCVIYDSLYTELYKDMKKETTNE
jgi:2,4-dienoyl-CoA reductase-like NADH-dependent reductase (Old Yellow Enzyme family)